MAPSLIRPRRHGAARRGGRTLTSTQTDRVLRAGRSRRRRRRRRHGERLIKQATNNSFRITNQPLNNPASLHLQQSRRRRSHHLHRRACSPPQFAAAAMAMLLPRSSSAPFNKPKELFGKFPKQRVFIAPPDRSGTQDRVKGISRVARALHLLPGKGRATTSRNSGEGEPSTANVARAGNGAGHHRCPQEQLGRPVPAGATSAHRIGQAAAEIDQRSGHKGEADRFCCRRAAGPRSAIPSQARPGTPRRTADTLAPARGGRAQAGRFRHRGSRASAISRGAGTGAEKHAADEQGNEGGGGGGLGTSPPHPG